VDEVARAGAERKIRKWQSQRPFDEPLRFQQRLALWGLDLADLRALLSEPAERLAARGATPAWMEEIHACLTEDRAPVPTPGQVADYAFAGALRAFSPFVRRGRGRLSARMEEMARQRGSLPFDPAAALEMVYPWLPAVLITSASRVLALEINVARLHGSLPGETAEERFRAFLDRLATPEGLSGLFDEYPVLARAFAEQVDRWVEVSAELLDRLSADMASLRETFFEGRDPGRVAKLEGGMGDTHRGGRSVHIVTFESGEKVVYKPRPMGADARFQALLGWLNDRGQTPPLRAIRVLDRGDYGFIEHVTVGPCDDAAALTRFYERQGANLAILYALDASDFHHENLLAAGEHPIPIDLEVLFHPRFEVTGPVGSVAAAGDLLNDSVLRIGLLPSRTFGGNGGRGIDVSGIGGGSGQVTPFAVPQWEARGTDAIFLGKRAQVVPTAENRPTLRGAEVDALEYIESILGGFERTYRLLVAHKDELLSPSGPVCAFAGDEVRVLVRATQAYNGLLVQSFHPDLLRDAAERDAHFDRLWHVAGELPCREAVIEAERADLLRGDIPLFTARPGSRDLWTSRGERIEGFFETSSLSNALLRVERLSDEDLATQAHFVRTSLATLRIGRDPAPRRSWTPVVRKPGERGALGEGSREELSQRLLRAARAAGDKLAASAITRGAQTTWVGMNLVDDNYWMLAALDVDLYSGLAGVALFLGALGAATGEERYHRLARGALASLHAQQDQEGVRKTNIGGFNGRGGLVYALSQLGVLFGDRALLSAAVEQADVIASLAEGDVDLDLTNGSAGAILSLLDLHRRAPSPRLLQTAILCGERLLSTAVPMERGLAWVTRMPQMRPLCGMSHGVSGMSLALAALGAATGQARFTQAARGALEYEATSFSEERGNWADLRTDLFPQENAPPPEPDFSVTWCHGATGVGHARLGMRQVLGDASLESDLRIAIATTLREGFGRSHCICHGDFGSIDLLAETGRILGDPALTALAFAGAEGVLDEIERVGYRCGVPAGAEAPGLMAGVAGIGYGFLRLVRPDITPAVLTLGATAAPVSLSGEGKIAA